MTTIVMKYQHWIPMAGRLFGSQSLHVPVDLVAVCLWAMTGLMVTALVATFEPSAALAPTLAATHYLPSSLPSIPPPPSPSPTSTPPSPPPPPPRHPPPPTPTPP